MEQSRRVFLGSTAAVGSAAVIGGAFLFNDRGASAQSGGDLVARELRRQQREAIRALRGPKAGEAARKLGSLLRLAAAATAADEARINAAIRASVRRQGKDHFVLQELDAAHLAALLQEAGLPRGAAVRRPPPDLAARAAALDELLTSGVSAMLTKAALHFEAISADADAQAAVIRPAALRRMSKQCEQIERNLHDAQIYVAVVCGLFPGTAACAGAIGWLAGTWIAWETLC